MKIIKAFLFLILTGGGIAGFLDVISQKNSDHRVNGVYELFFKRSFDFMITSIAAVLLFPVMFVTACMVRIQLGAPVIFKQDRPGKGEKLFKLYKFRTMTSQRDDNGELLPDELRLTGFGKALRESSIDELPELVNIIKGDMAIVGPRPLLDRYLPYYTAEERQRHDVRPGLTGAAQVRGRNFLRWEERFRQDIFYVNNITFMGDLKIVILTVIKVLKKEDIMQADKDKKNMIFDDLDKERGGNND